MQWVIFVWVMQWTCASTVHPGVVSGHSGLWFTLRVLDYSPKQLTLKTLLPCRPMGALADERPMRTESSRPLDADAESVVMKRPWRNDSSSSSCHTNLVLNPSCVCPTGFFPYPQTVTCSLVPALTFPLRPSRHTVCISTVYSPAHLSICSTLK